MISITDCYVISLTRLLLSEDRVRRFVLTLNLIKLNTFKKPVAFGGIISMPGAELPDKATSFLTIPHIPAPNNKPPPLYPARQLQHLSLMSRYLTSSTKKTAPKGGFNLQSGIWRVDLNLASPNPATSARGGRSLLALKFSASIFYHVSSLCQRF